MNNCKRTILTVTGIAIAAIMSVVAVAADYCTVSDYKETFTPTSATDSRLTVNITAEPDADGYVYISKTIKNMTIEGEATGTNLAGQAEEYEMGALTVFRIKAENPNEAVEAELTFACPDFYNAAPKAETTGTANIPVSYKFTNYLSNPIGKYSVTIALPQGMEFVKVSTPSKYSDFTLSQTGSGLRALTVSKSKLAPAAAVTAAFTFNDAGVSAGLPKLAVWVVCLAIGGLILLAKLKENGIGSKK